METNEPPAYQDRIPILREAVDYLSAIIYAALSRRNEHHALKVNYRSGATRAVLASQANTAHAYQKTTDWYDETLGLPVQTPPIKALADVMVQLSNEIERVARAERKKRLNEGGLWDLVARVKLLQWEAHRLEGLS